jgi:hypothetical protein
MFINLILFAFSVANGRKFLIDKKSFFNVDLTLPISETRITFFEDKIIL